MKKIYIASLTTERIASGLKKLLKHVSDHNFYNIIMFCFEYNIKAYTLEHILKVYHYMTNNYDQQLNDSIYIFEKY